VGTRYNRASGGYSALEPSGDLGETRLRPARLERGGGRRRSRGPNEPRAEQLGRCHATGPGPDATPCSCRRLVALSVLARRGQAPVLDRRLSDKREEPTGPLAYAAGPRGEGLRGEARCFSRAERPVLSALWHRGRSYVLVAPVGVSVECGFADTFRSDESVSGLPDSSPRVVPTSGRAWRLSLQGSGRVTATPGGKGAAGEGFGDQPRPGPRQRRSPPGSHASSTTSTGCWSVSSSRLPITRSVRLPSGIVSPRGRRAGVLEVTTSCLAGGHAGPRFQTRPVERPRGGGLSTL
jgi:hypothetical protein